MRSALHTLKQKLDAIFGHLRGVWYAVEPFIKPAAQAIWRFLQKAFDRQPGWFGSMGVHLVLLVLIIGVPSCQTRDEEPIIIPVELLNLPTQKEDPTPTPPKPKPEKPKEEVKQAPKPPPPVPSEYKKPAEKVKPKPEKPKAKPKPQTPPAIAKPRSKPKPPTPPKPKPKQKVKEKPKEKPKPKVKERPKKDTSETDKLLQDFLNDVNRDKQERADKAVRNPREIDRIHEAIKADMKAAWKVPSGTKGADEMVIPLDFELDMRGRIKGQVRVVDQSRYRSDAAFRAVADSAKRAIYQAAPFEFIKPENYYAVEDGIRINALPPVD